MRKAQDAVAGPHRIGGGNALQRRRPGLDDEVVERQLEGGLAVLALRRGGIRLLAHGDEPADIHIGGQIEMRDGLLGLDQPLGDGRAHPVERHFLVSDALVQRLDLRGAGAGRHAARRGGSRLLDVGGNDAAVRAGAA